MRQVVLADNDLHVHAKVVFAAQDLHHPAARALRRRGPVDDLDVHDHAFEVVIALRAPRLAAHHTVNRGLRRPVRTWLLLAFRLLW